MKIGILCAIPNEIKYFDLNLNLARKIGGRLFFRKKEKSHELILVECGIGKVNAASVSTLLIQEFGCELLIFSGIAGGIDPELKIGDVIVGESFIQYDYGAIIKGQFQIYRAGSVPVGPPRKDEIFKIESGIKKRLKKILPRLKMGTILTGDIFLRCPEKRKDLYEQFSAQVTEMEGGAVVQVTEQFGISSIVVRSVSDLAGGNQENNTYNFMNQAAKYSFETVQSILKALPKEIS